MGPDILIFCLEARKRWPENFLSESTRYWLTLKQIVFFMAVVGLGTNPSYSQTKIRIASDDWCPYVCVDNGQISGGFLVDVVTEAMKLRDIQVESVLVPFSRAMNEAKFGIVQGIYSPPNDPRLSMSASISYARSCFYTLADSTWFYKNLGSLQNITVGVIPDYNYDDATFDDYVLKNRSNTLLIDMAYGEYAGVNNLKKLLAGRFRVMVEDEAVMATLIQKLPNNKKNRQAIKQAGCLENPINVRIGFSKNDNHVDEWVKALNAGLQQLESSGKLAVLQRRYQIPVTTPGSAAVH